MELTTFLACKGWKVQKSDRDINYSFAVTSRLVKVLGDIYNVGAKLSKSVPQNTRVVQ